MLNIIKLISLLLLCFHSNNSHGIENKCLIKKEGYSSSTLDLSYIQLISSPEKYYGKIISLRGVLDVEYGKTLLYFEERSKKHLILKESVLLEFGVEQQNLNLSKYSGQFFEVIGKFEKSGFQKASGQLQEIDFLCKLTPFYP